MSDIVISNPQSLIELALKNNVGIKQLKELMELKKEYDAGEARKSFYQAMTLFQSGCPVLKKTKKVDFDLKTGGKIKYNYAPLGSIADQIKSVIEKCGLSYRWTIDDKSDKINVTCIVSHKDGHSESTTMSGNLDDSGKKNAIQQRGSTVTYLQRYTLIGALGITSADDDNDGTAAAKPETKKKPVLDPKSDKWDMAVDGLVKKSVTMTTLKDHYTISKEDESLLWKNVKNIQGNLK